MRQFGFRVYAKFSTTNSAMSFTRHCPCPAGSDVRPASNITRQNGQPVATVCAPVADYFPGAVKTAQLPRGEFIAYNRERGADLAGRVF